LTNRPVTPMDRIIYSRLTATPAAKPGTRALRRMWPKTKVYHTEEKAPIPTAGGNHSRVSPAAARPSKR